MRAIKAIKWKKWKKPYSKRQRAILRMLGRQGHRCFYCGGTLKNCATVDHLIPKSKNGSRSAANKVIACYWCNTRKGSDTNFYGHDTERIGVRKSS